jgi:hypothetical protein
MNYEQTKGGILLPKHELKLAGRYRGTIFRAKGGVEDFECDNICVNEGMTAALNILFAGASVISTWYVAVFQNNYTPVATDTAASITSNAGEFTGYSGGARPTFTAAVPTTPSVTNSASRATFNFTGSATLTGAFLVSNATPGANSGTLFSAALFGSSKSVGNGDQLLLTYTLNATSV